ALYEAVNRRTERLAKELNAFLEAEAVAFRVAWFGSQFRFEALGDAFDLEVLFYLLTEAGFYTWEQRICCLSTAHTDEEIDRLIAAVRHAVAQMRAGGFAIQAGPAAPRRVLPLSSVQERLYALCQREGAEMPYHLSGVWELRGKVDAFRLQDAFQEVVRRHESLRTAFGQIAGKPCQYVIEEPRFFLEQVDAAGRTPDAVLEAFVRPFDLERPPLLRVGYAPIGEERGLLLIDVHHIAADGLSMNVILREFAALYDGQKLRPVKRQYRHAVDEAEQRRATPDYRAQEEYWLAQMRGEIPALELPADFPRSGEMDFRGGKCLLKIDAQRTLRLEKLARERGASLYMVLMGVFTTLLHRLTEAEDVIVGLPVAGRPGADNDEVVGMFVNSLPLRFRPRAGQPFAELLREVRGLCLGAYDNSEYAFGELVGRLDLPRNPDRNPLFDAMFAYENADERVMRTRGLEIRTIDQYEGSGMFDLSVDIIREAGVLNVRFHYATRLFRAETVERWSQAFSRLVDAALAEPERPIGGLPLLSPAELEQVSERFNASSGVAHPPTTLVALWDASVRRTPGAVAIVSGERRLTYREVDALALHVAGRLVNEHHTSPGDLVALLLEPGEHMIASILGVLKAGAAYVPIDPANPAERVRALVKDARAKVLIADHAAEASAAPVVTVESLFAESDSAVTATLVAPRPESLAYVIYTSGSTGLPKGVLIEHRGIANSVQWRVEAYGFTPHDVTLQMPSYAFDASLLDIFPVLAVGGRLVLVDSAAKRDLTAQAALMQREGVTNLLLTPSLHALYLQEVGAAMTGLRFVCVAGEATTFALVRRHFERLPRVRLFNEYGPTENSVVSTFTELQPTDALVTIGRPVAGNRLHVLQQNGERCGVGVIGELVVTGPGLARGYLERPELTAAVFAPAPWDDSLRIYRTGDLARWLPDGTLEFFGRRDGQVKLRGYRIELGEVEDVLQRQPGITAVAAKVVALGSEQQLVAYVTAGDGYDEAAVRGALQRALPAYMVPTLFVRLESMPLNISGKIDRRALPLPVVTKSANGEPPRGPRETVLAEVWSEVLRHASIGRDDDYFRLGGDSIKGIQIISRLLQRGWRLDMRWLFRYPTIAGLAPQLQEMRSAAAVPAVEPAGDIPLGAIQRWFFRAVTVRPDHFNQAVWLIARDRWKVDALASALRQVTAAHAAFRTRYVRDGGSWRQTAVESDGSIALRTLNLRGAADAGTQAAELVQAEQSGLDLAHGPLSRAAIVHFDGEDGLLWVVHHLAVDGVSWRILLDDLATAYAAACAGESVTLAAPSASFAAWTRSVQTRLAAGAFDADAEFWECELAPSLPKLPQDRGGPAGTVAKLATLTRTTPARLGAAAHGAYRTRGIELYLAALRLAYTEWNPGEDLLVLLEGHGREAALADIDVGRTVGWFTSVYPLRFGAAAAGAAGQLIRETKERVRRVPRNGASFGWLCESGRASGLAERPQPELSFNFLGDLGGEAGAGFTLSPERPGHAQDPRQTLVQPIALYGYSAEGRLYWTLDYDGTRFAPEVMRALLDRFVAALDRVAEQTSAVPTGIPSPVDFTFAGLELAAFDR
ncbi:MAG TPA: amino acid adenylation domain-containing protein, partial [Opitutaceae bacterium]